MPVVSTRRTRATGSGQGLSLVALAAIAACGKAAPTPQPRPASAVAAAASPKASAAPVPDPGRPPPHSVEPPPVTEEILAAQAAHPDDPPEYAALKLKLLRGAPGAGALKALQSLAGKHPKHAEIPFLMGQIYLEKLWVDDGLKAFRRAIQADPSLRSNPFLIRAAVAGLGNDRDAAKVQRFLAQDVGLDAAPYLEDVLWSEWRQQVKERAAATLRELK